MGDVQKKQDFRVEKDSIGTKDVPQNVYYGVQSLRAAENFHITGLNMHPEIINSLAYIKKAAAITNCDEITGFHVWSLPTRQTSDLGGFCCNSSKDL